MDTTKIKCDWNDPFPSRRQRLIKKQNSRSRLLQLPEDIIRRILLLLPAKSASRMSCVSKQLEGSWIAWCSAPVINLDDDDGLCTNNIASTNMLQRYLKFRTERKDRPDPRLEKFRFRMGMTGCDYLEITTTEEIVEKLLSSFALESSIKELDLSNLRTGFFLWAYLFDSIKEGLSLQALVNVKSLTSLSLESLKIEDDVTSRCALLLPSLKTISLKSVRLTVEVLNDLISKCPSIEYLSLTDCRDHSGWYEPFERFSIARSRTLRELETKDCSFNYISVHECEVLECVTLSTEKRYITIELIECGNLKYINLSSQFVPEVELQIEGCNDCAKLRVDFPDTCRFVLNNRVVTG